MQCLETVTDLTRYSISYELKKRYHANCETMCHLNIFNVLMDIRLQTISSNVIQDKLNLFHVLMTYIGEHNLRNLIQHSPIIYK